MGSCSGRCRALPARRAFVPKGKDEVRPLGIAAAEDKIVQHAAADILERICEQDFMGFSYGFRPRLGCRDALDALSVAIARKKANWILDADIKGFFNSISHVHLMLLLKRRIGGPRILGLISNWLKAGVIEGGERRSSEGGSQQGGVASPLLANAFLHCVLGELAVSFRKAAFKGDVAFVRHADDFAAGFQYEHEAKQFLHVLKERLQRFGLALHPDKARLIEFGRFAAAN